MDRARVIYLDTHVLVRLYLGEVSKLGAAAKRAIEDHETLASPAAVLELQLLHEIGRLKPTADQFIQALSKDLLLRVCDMPFYHVVQHALAETWCRDPFDRLIVANAKANNAALVSKDERIHENYRRAVW